MNDTNTVTLFPCKDAASDGCPNDTTQPDTHCADCHLFYEELESAKALLADDSWKSPVESSEIVAGFEVVEVVPAVAPEPAKPDLDSVCYTMNAAEVDAQAALYEIAAVLAKYQDTLKQIDGVLAAYEVH